MFEKAADTARPWEWVKMQTVSAVDAAGWRRQQKQPQRHNKPPSRHNQRQQTVNSDNKCTRCWSTRHEACPGIGAECRKCGKEGNVASVCQICQRSQNSSSMRTRLVFCVLLPRVCAVWRLWPSLESDTSGLGQANWVQDCLRRRYVNHVWRNLQCHEAET